MKISLGLKIGQTEKIQQTFASELPDTNVYLADPQGNRYVDEQGNYYVQE